MTLTYFGHSAFQIETNGTTLLFDPFISGNLHTEGVVKADDLKPDVILLTHVHPDHWGDTAQIAKRTGAQVVAVWEVAMYLNSKHSYENVQPMNTGGSWNFSWGRVKQTYARHSSSFPDGTYGGNPNGYLLEIEGKTIYNTGDTDLFSEMAWVSERPIDVAFLPIGDCFTMGPTASIKALQMIKPGLAIPLHYNTFPYIQTDPEAWSRDAQKAGFKTKVMKPGEALEL